MFPTYWLEEKNDHIFYKISFIYSLTISYIWTIYFGHFHPQLSHPSLSRYSQCAPFPFYVPFLCFVAHQILVLPGLLECWFILSAQYYTGLAKWSSFPDDSYLNVFIDVILSISVPYHFWILCNGFGLPVYPELESKEKNRVPLYLCHFRRASWTGGASEEPSNSLCDLPKQCRQSGQPKCHGLYPTNLLTGLDTGWLHPVIIIWISHFSTGNFCT